MLLLVCSFPSSPLLSTCSSSAPDFHFHQLIPVAFVVVQCCIRAYEYVVGEAKMTKIFAVYLQASGFLSQSSEYALECCSKQLKRYGRTPLLMLILLLVCVAGLSTSCWCTFPSGVRRTHLQSAVLEARSVLLEIVLSRKLSRSGRMRCRVGYYIICTSPLVGLRCGCGLSLNICF